MGLFGNSNKRANIDDLTEVRREAPSLADMLVGAVERSAQRSDEIFALLDGRADQQQCSALAELERLGVIQDIRHDGTVAAGPNMHSYRGGAS